MQRQWWHQRELQRIHGDPDPDGNCHGIRLSDRAAIGPLQQCQRQSLNGGPCHHGGVEWQQPLQQRQRPLLRIRGFGGYQLVFGPRSDRRPRSVRHAGVPGDHHLGLRKRLPDAESVRFGLDRGVRRDDRRGLAMGDGTGSWQCPHLHELERGRAEQLRRRGLCPHDVVDVAGGPME